MDFIQRLVHYFAVVRRQMRRHRRLVVTCAAVVVFATTYALILPAITLDEDTANDTPGVSIEQPAADSADAVNAADGEQQAANDASEPSADQADTMAAGEAAAAELQASDKDSKYDVTVSYGEDARLAAGTTLRVTELTGSDYDAAKAKVVEAKGAADEPTDDLGVAAIDVSILDASGNEVEPADGAKVYVKIFAKDVLPEGADASTVEVQHLNEQADTVDTVADVASSTDDSKLEVSDKNASADFSVSSFSTFTITWGNGTGTDSSTAYLRWYQSSTWVSEITIHYVDSGGNEIDRPSDTDLGLNYGGTTWYTTNNTATKRLSDFAVAIDGYGTPTVHLGSRDGSVATSVSFERSIRSRNYTYKTTINGENGSLASGTATYRSSMFGGGYYEPYTNDIYVVYPKGSQEDNQATIIYEDGDGKELTISNSAASQNDSAGNYKYLIYDVDGYEYDHAYVVHNGTSTSIDPYLYRDSASSPWNYYGQSSSSDDLTADATQVKSGDVIHVVYKAKTQPTQGGTPSSTGGTTDWPSKPTVSKTSTDNGNGTRTLALSIKGAEATSTEKAKADVIVVLDTSGSMRYDMDDDTGTSNARLNAAKSALDTLADTLLTADNDDAIRMSLVTFSTQENGTHAFTGDNSAFKAYYSGLSATGGTNWEDALATANRMEVRPDAATYVIFVTDGDPTYRNSRGSFTDAQLTGDDIYRPYGPDYSETYSYDGTQNTATYYRGGHVFGRGSSDNNNGNYEAALAEARSIISHNKNFYTIGMGPSVDKLSGFTSDLGLATSGDSSHYFLATSNAQLTDAFSTIASSITTRLGYADVRVTDGITSLTNLSGKASETTGDFTYTMTDANGSSLTVPDSLKTAYYDDDSTSSTYGSVVWNLPENYQLEDGVTYKVEFTVWPSQEALDHVAKLNNGTETWNSLGDDVKAQISQPTTAGGSYTLKTNTSDANVKVKESTSVGDSTSATGNDITLDFGKVDPLKLSDQQVTITKDWGTDKSHETDDLTKDGVNVTISDGVDGGVSKTLTLTSDNSWSGTANISAGFALKNSDGTLDVLESGHDFTLSEAALTSYTGTGSISDYWTLTAGTYRPMIIDGTMTLLVKGAVDGATQYTFDGSTYSVVTTGNAITATNTARFVSIILRKVDQNNKGLTGAEFTLEKQGRDLQGAETWTAVGTGKVTVDKADGVTVSHLTDGTYRLTETKAPDGYVIITDAPTFTITNGALTKGTGTGDVMVVDDSTKTVSITNTPGTPLPSTGGTGSLPYLLGGSALITTAILGYALRRRSGGGETD